MLNAGSLLGIVDRLFLGIIDEGLTGGDVLFQLLQRALELRVYSLCDSQHVVYRLYRLSFRFATADTFMVTLPAFFTLLPLLRFSSMSCKHQQPLVHSHLPIYYRL